MLGILNRKISTKTGVIVLLLVASLAGYLMLRQYIAFMETRYAPIDILINEN